MNLDHLRAFVAVAEAGGFSRAAAIAATTQPTLSRQVKALEDELGRPLLDRLGRRVQLTEFGRQVLQKARPLLAAADELVHAARMSQGRVVGELRLGAADSVVLSRAPVVLKRFQRRHPHVRVHVRTGVSPDILSWVRDGSVDAGLCMLPDMHPGLTLLPLWDDSFVAIVPPKHRLANRRAALPTFAAERQLVIRPGTLSYQVISSAFQSAGMSLVPDMDFERFHLIIGFVAAGMGVGVSSAVEAQAALRREQVARVRIKEIDAAQRPLGLALHVDRVPDGPLAAFLEEVERATS